MYDCIFPVYSGLQYRCCVCGNTLHTVDTGLTTYMTSDSYSMRKDCARLSWANITYDNRLYILCPTACGEVFNINPLPYIEKEAAERARNSLYNICTSFDLADNLAK